MARCKYCAKSGFFMSTDALGLCQICSATFRSEVFQKARIISESGSIIDRGKKLDTRLARCDLIIQLAEDLSRYETRGIWNLDFSPTSLRNSFIKKREELLIEDANAAATMAIEKSRHSSSAKTAIGLLSKAIIRIEGYIKEVQNTAPLLDNCDQLRAEAHRTQLCDFVNSAKKAEFKGNKKKAIDQYKEALYFLLNDDVPDERQEKAIRWLRNKVAELEN